MEQRFRPDVILITQNVAKGAACVVGNFESVGRVGNKGIAVELDCIFTNQVLTQIFHLCNVTNQAHYVALKIRFELPVATLPLDRYH